MRDHQQGHVDDRDRIGGTRLPRDPGKAQPNGGVLGRLELRNCWPEKLKGAPPVLPLLEGDYSLARQSCPRERATRHLLVAGGDQEDFSLNIRPVGTSGFGPSARSVYPRWGSYARRFFGASPGFSPRDLGHSSGSEFWQTF